ncbi:hypothetical protein [Halalkalicoccus salilacus]|uniref:hypothetical protein n=1 Tax=Halalkalicoccus salilacus TaxID=3117459 RepID=UPI00300F3887
MNFLEELGKEDIQLKKQRGKKLVVVDPEAATRYAAHHDRCDGKEWSNPRRRRDIERITPHHRV